MRKCRWCGYRLAAYAPTRYHARCAKERARLQAHGWEDTDWMPDTEGVIQLVGGFWGSAVDPAVGSVRGDLRRGCWDTLRWILGWDATRGADFAWWCGVSGVEPDVLRRNLLRWWRPRGGQQRCRRCGASWDAVRFMFPSAVHCKECYDKVWSANRKVKQ